MRAEVISISPPTAAVTSPLSGISVIPDWGLGHSEPRGYTCGTYSQSDVVDAYVVRLLEELEAESVRSTHVNTRKTPALAPKDRVAEAAAGHMALICSCDFYMRERGTNTSVVEFSGAHLKQLAQRLSESLGDWGRCSSFDHRGTLPVSVTEPGHFIRIKPFSLNGPHADAYLRRLDQIGVAIGRAIGDYFTEKNILRRKR